MIMINIQANV